MRYLLNCFMRLNFVTEVRNCLVSNDCILADIFSVNLNMIRLKSYFIFFFTALVAWLSSTDCVAQTYRVRAGNGGNGEKAYMEVYEYDYVTQKPVFPGGTAKLVAFINKNRRYPAEAYKKGIQGRVTCSFVVNVDGSVSHISILKGVEHSLNKEALRIMGKMPEWTPGVLDGQTVPVRVIWSVPFRK